MNKKTIDFGIPIETENSYELKIVQAYIFGLWFVHRRYEGDKWIVSYCDGKRLPYGYDTLRQAATLARALQHSESFFNAYQRQAQVMDLVRYHTPHF